MLLINILQIICIWFMFLLFELGVFGIDAASMLYAKLPADALSADDDIRYKRFGNIGTAFRIACFAVYGVGTFVISMLTVYKKTEAFSSTITVTAVLWLICFIVYNIAYAKQNEIAKKYKQAI